MPHTEVVSLGPHRFRIRPKSPDRLILDAAYQESRFFVEELDLGPGSFVLDGGAHIGVFSMLAAHRWQGAKIYAAEPDPENFALLKENLALNAATSASVIPLQRALGGRGGPVTLVLSDENWGHALLEDGVSSEGRSTVCVLAETLADVLVRIGTEQIDFTKLNIEGAEYGFLGDAEIEALRCLKTILVEIHPTTPARQEALFDKLRVAGHAIDTTWDPNEPGKGWLTARLQKGTQ